MASPAYQALILHDGITGHLRQCQAVAQLLHDELHTQNAFLKISELLVPVKYRPSWIQKFFFYLTHPLAKFCPSCSRCVRYSLPKKEWDHLCTLNPNVVISVFGKRVSDINAWFAKKTGSRSIVLMKPKNNLNRFDLVIVPRHDQVAEEGPVLVTDGAPNLMSQEEVTKQSLLLEKELGRFRPLVIGALFGGDYKKFKMDEKTVATLIQGLKETSKKFNADLLLTTSRRTPERISSLLESELRECPDAKLLVIASKKNRSGVVAGILGLCQVVIVSPESVSMISEAASSGAHVLVYLQKDFMTEKHQAFLNHLSAESYIRGIPPEKLSEELETFIKTHKKTRRLDDSSKIRRALKEKIVPLLLGKRA